MLTAEKIHEFKRDHGDRLMAIEHPAEMVFKSPEREVWADFQDAVSKDKGTRELAYRRLCLACCVHPAIDQAVQVFDAYPALPTRIGDKLSHLVGLGDDFEVKKL